MALTPWLRGIARVLAYSRVDICKHYRAIRRLAIWTAPSPFRPVRRITDGSIPIDAHTSIPVRLYRPKGSGPFPLIIYFHGGGWVLGNLNSYDMICRAMTIQTGHAVLSVQYRCAPEYRFPIPPEDCYAVTRHVFSGHYLQDVQPGQITLMGDSAGGNLASVVSLMARDRGEFLPRKQILIYPACNNDYTENSAFSSVRDFGEHYFLTAKHIRQFIELYLKSEEDRNNPYFAPILSTDLSNQPKTLSIAAEYDPLRDEAKAYCDALNRAGNQAYYHCIHGTLHGFLSLGARHKHVRECYAHINNFLHDTE